MNLLDDMRIEEIRDVWDGADLDALGRVLRAQLLVEHYVKEQFEKHYPNANDLPHAGLRHYHRLCLLDRTVLFVADLVPGLKALNSLRNKFAHRLNYRVTDDDVKPFFAPPGFFDPFYRKYLKVEGVTSPTPMHAVEYFALFASIWLRGGAVIEDYLAKEQRRLEQEGRRLELEKAAIDAERALLDDLESSYRVEPESESE